MLDEVVDQQETVIVRRRGARDVALIPATELAGLYEAAHLLRSPRNARRLLSALRRAEAGNVKRTVKREAKRVALSQPEFLQDLRFWVKNEPAAAVRIFDLVDAVMRDTFEGPGKPEPLNTRSAAVGPGESLRSTGLVYGITDEAVDFLQGKYHY